MYHALIDGNLVPVERLNWVKLQDNGIYVTCEEQEGQGIILGGEIYHVSGRKEIDKITVDLVWKDDVTELKNSASISFVALAQAELIDDSTISEHSDLFMVWDEHFTGERGSIILDPDDKSLYRSVHPIIDPTQNIQPSKDKNGQMWCCIGNPDEEYPEWSQPLGAHDVYMSGDKVYHVDKRWISEVDNNVWEPSIYGWKEDGAIE